MSDWAIALFAVQFAAFALLYLIPLWQSRVFPCPACKKKLSRKLIGREEIPCPNCGWQAVKPEMVEAIERELATLPSTAESKPASAPPKICYHCQGSKADHRFARLWDGNRYCFTCIEETCPEILEYAQTHKKLEETLPHSVWEVAKRAFLTATWAPATLLISPFAFMAGMKHGGFWEGIEAILVCQILVLPLSLVFVISIAYGVSIGRPTVRLRNGRLEVRWGDIRSERINLSECEWWVGDVAYVTIFTNRPSLCRGQGVLIEYPTNDRGPRKHTIAAVGFTEETRRIWIGFLTLSGLLRRTAYESDKPCSMINVAGWLFGIALIFGAIFLAAPAHWLVLLLTGDHEVSRLIAFQLFLPGSFYLCGYMMHFWPWDNRELIPRSDQAERKKIARRWIWISLLAASLIYVPMLSWRDYRLESRLIAAAFGLIVALLVGYDLGQRMAAWERKKTIDD